MKNEKYNFFSETEYCWRNDLNLNNIPSYVSTIFSSLQYFFRATEDKSSWIIQISGVIFTKIKTKNYTFPLSIKTNVITHAFLQNLYIYTFKTSFIYKGEIIFDFIYTIVVWKHIIYHFVFKVCNSFLSFIRYILFEYKFSQSLFGKLYFLYILSVLLLSGFSIMLNSSIEPHLAKCHFPSSKLLILASLNVFTTPGPKMFSKI